MNTAIYNYTDGNNKRPIVTQKANDELIAYALSQGLEVKDIFFEKRIIEAQPELHRLINEYDNYDAVVIKDLRHLSRKTKTSISIAKHFTENEKKLYLMNYGEFKFTDAPFDKPYRVVTYNAHRFNNNALIEVQKDIRTLFIAKKTNWTIIDNYIDVNSSRSKFKQTELQKLIENKAKYDILLVNNLADIHTDSIRFFKTFEETGLSIYSLEDGYLSARKD